MVCPRCVMAVEQILKRLDVPFHDVNIGSINLSRPFTEEELIQFDLELNMIGFEVLKDRKQILVEEIKIALSEMLNAEESMLVKTSTYLAERFNLEYSYLSSVFSEIQGESIEKYLINLKVEKVKELLSYDATLAEIAAQLQYSSIAHLSNQFKKTTGVSPSVYKKQLV